jgi:predicted ABC-type ATPase
MAEREPRVVVLAGPNGDGKSTSAAKLLRGAVRVDEFVNADLIASGLSAFAPQRAALAAGRVMLHRIRDLAAANASFAFETTLASRTFAPWLKGLQASGYFVNLVFLWLPSAEMALARVADRVLQGGHNVPDATVRRRYHVGLANFFSHYQPLADSWQFVDNSVVGESSVIASGTGLDTNEVRDQVLWQQILASAQ